MSDQPGLPFGRESAVDVLQSACAAVGFDPDGAELLRLGENAIFRLDDSPVVVRIARGPDYRASAIKEVNVARWLAEAGVDAARAWDVDQPIDVGGHPVTFWHYIAGRRGGPGDVRALGLTLRRLHDLPPPREFAVPEEDILARVEPRIARSPIPSQDRVFLTSLVADLRTEVKALEFPLDTAVTHGDAHVQNLMFRESGEVVLIDFERVSFGQPEWDLSMTATEHVTAQWWTSAQYSEFARCYGFDILDWPGFDVLRRVHEIKMTTWLMQNINESSAIHDEYARRMATIRDGVRDVRWTTF
ncbi:phosphotransferase enzyme family protein [Pseudonocardia nigra]|uniref:phosphotransferase enzyme family protein n=1 Tax=Pseudonocardia nigra TaxID=1921578 RepID=UPI001C5F5C62|nr:aminoglycoside phosphotransferase family protein [Pseudonocardia nigra]